VFSGIEVGKTFKRPTLDWAIDGEGSHQVIFNFEIV